MMSYDAHDEWKMTRGEDSCGEGEGVRAREEMKCIMSGGAKRRRKKGKSPGERRERGEGEEKEVKKPRRKKKAGRRRRKRSEKPRRKKKAGRRRRKSREKAPEEEESGAKEREKKGRSPAKEMKLSRGEKYGRICTHLRVQICAGKCIRAGINCLLMNMCREFDLIFQM